MCSAAKDGFVVLLALAVCIICQADNPATVTSKVWFDVSIGGEPAGRIVMGMFGNTAPKTVENFEKIADGTSDLPTFKGTIFHRTINEFMIQGGDIHNREGHGGASIYGPYFDDENFTLNHYGAGWVSMANAGPDTNSSQFFITLIPCPWLDGKHTVFAKVLEGMDLVKRIGANPTKDNDRPIKEVKITECGVDKVSTPFVVAMEAVTQN